MLDRKTKCKKVNGRKVRQKKQYTRLPWPIKRLLSYLWINSLIYHVRFINCLKKLDKLFLENQRGCRFLN